MSNAHSAIHVLMNVWMLESCESVGRLYTPPLSSDEWATPPPSLDTPLPPRMGDRMILQSWIILTAHGSCSYVCNLLGACDNLQAATVCTTTSTSSNIGYTTKVNKLMLQLVLTY